MSSGSSRPNAPVSWLVRGGDVMVFINHFLMPLDYFPKPSGHAPTTSLARQGDCADFAASLGQKKAGQQVARPLQLVCALVPPTFLSFATVGETSMSVSHPPKAAIRCPSS